MWQITWTTGAIVGMASISSIVCVSLHFVVDDLHTRTLTFCSWCSETTASHSLTSLLDLLRKKKDLKRKHLELLLTKCLAVFDLSEEDKNGGPNDMSEYLRLASARCPVGTTVLPNFSPVVIHLTY